jgi:hypothetical protein
MHSTSFQKLLIRNSKSRKFLKSTGRWTKKVDAAFNFPNPLNAIHTCLEKEMKGVELILRFEGDAVEHCIPLDGA